MASQESYLFNFLVASSAIAMETKVQRRICRSETILPIPLVSKGNKRNENTYYV